MNIYKKVSLFLLIIILSFINVRISYAATVKTGDSIYLSEEKQYEDLYLFGSTITAEAPIKNDLIAAGGEVTLNGDVTGSLMAAGGTLTIRSNVDNTMRVAAGDVIISGTITRDVLIAAGVARITKTASISGDLIFIGSELVVEGTVKGKVNATGEQVTINSRVGSVEGNMGLLTLGKKTIIEKELRYSSPTKAAIHESATIQGKTYYSAVKQEPKNTQGILRAFTPGALYTLFLDMLLSLGVVVFLPNFVKKIIATLSKSPLNSAGTGFFFVIFWPLLSLVMLFLLWLSLISFLFYALILITSIFLMKIVVGWRLLKWWHMHQKTTEKYQINSWKTAVVGSIAVYILMLIPIIGWIILIFIYLLTVGATVKAFLSFVQSSRISNKK